MCAPSSAEKNQANKLNTLADSMASQATTVFGADNQVFNDMKKSYDTTVANGPNQHGFNQAELNARNAQAITNNANQFRNVAGAVKSGQAAYGGGNTVSGAGVTTGQNLGVAQAAAANTANDLSNISAQDWETGRQNYQFASAHEQELPGVFNNLPGMNQTALAGRKDALQEQQSLDTQSGWWKGPVMGLVNGGLSLATGGLSSIASGNSFMGGVGDSLDKMSGSFAGQKS